MATETQPITPEALATDLNRVVLSGRLREPPELHELPENISVCFLHVQCTDHKRPDLLGDELPLTVSVLLLGGAANKMAPHLNTGKQVVIDGSLACAQWEASGTPPEETVCILGEKVEFLNTGSQRKLVWPADETRPADRDHSPMLGFSEDVWL